MIKKVILLILAIALFLPCHAMAQGFMRTDNENSVLMFKREATYEQRGLSLAERQAIRQGNEEGGINQKQMQELQDKFGKRLGDGGSIGKSPRGILSGNIPQETNKKAGIGGNNRFGSTQNNVTNDDVGPAQKPIVLTPESLSIGKRGSFRR